MDGKPAKSPVKIPQKPIKNLQKTAKKCKSALAHLTIRGFGEHRPPGRRDRRVPQKRPPKTAKCSLKKLSTSDCLRKSNRGPPFNPKSEISLFAVGPLRGGWASVKLKPETRNRLSTVHSAIRKAFPPSLCPSVPSSLVVLRPSLFYPSDRRRNKSAPNPIANTT